MKETESYRDVFYEYGGIMRTGSLVKEGITYPVLQKLLREGKIEKIKYGYYQWQDDKSFSEIAVLSSLFPEAILSDMTAAMHYGYTDRVPGVWHISVDSRTARKKFEMDFPKIKPHFIEEKRLNIGVTECIMEGCNVKIYDRERVVCDCLRHIDRMDGEQFNVLVKRYVNDKEKNAARLMEYAKKLGVEEKARRIVGVWL